MRSARLSNPLLDGALASFAHAKRSAFCVAHVCVLLCVFMPLRTVGDCFVRSRRSFDAVSTWAGTTANILSARHWLQVSRIDATPNSAEVVELKPLGNGADDQFVKHPVCEFRNRVYAARNAHPDSGVSVAVDFCKPEPATGVWLRGNVAHDSFEGWDAHMRIVPQMLRLQA